MKGSVRPIAIAGLVGLILMIFFLATGALSPEPSHYPEWWLKLVEKTVPGRILFLVVMALCFPAWFVAVWILSNVWEVAYWVLACVVQVLLYSIAAVGFGTLIRWFRHARALRITRKCETRDPPKN